MGKENVKSLSPKVMLEDRKDNPQAFTLYRKHALQLTLQQTDPWFLFDSSCARPELPTAGMKGPFHAASRRAEKEKKITHCHRYDCMSESMKLTGATETCHRSGECRGKTPDNLVRERRGPVR